MNGTRDKVQDEFQYDTPAEACDSEEYYTESTLRVSGSESDNNEGDSEVKPVVKPVVESDIDMEVESEVELEAQPKPEFEPEVPAQTMRTQSRRIQIQLGKKISRYTTVHKVPYRVK